MVFWGWVPNANFLKRFLLLLHYHSEPSGMFTKITSIISLLCLALSVSAADKYADYPVHPAASYAISAETSDLTIGLEPVEDLKDQKTYFDTELKPKGFIPVFLVMENKSKDDSFIFDKSAVTYGPADSGAATPNLHSKIRDNTALGVLASLDSITAFVAMAKVNHASHIQANILKKELQSTTLSPAASTHGFLYIPAPKSGPREKIHLRIPVTRMGSQGSESLALDLIF